MTEITRVEVERALLTLSATRAPDGWFDGTPLWVAPWPLVRDAIVLVDAGKLFLSNTVRPADWSDVAREAINRAG